MVGDNVLRNRRELYGSKTENIGAVESKSLQEWNDIETAIIPNPHRSIFRVILSEVAKIILCRGV